LEHLKNGKHGLANFISTLDLEELMTAGNPEAVNEIASFVEGTDVSLELLEFGTTYCNWHNQDSFPIYSADALQLFNFLIKDSSGFQPGNYKKFTKALSVFREVNNLEKLNFKELDKFIWLYAKRGKLAI